MKLNKPIAGYHLLMILSAVDGKFHAREDLIIRDWLVAQFPFNTNLDTELEVLSAMPEGNYFAHYCKVMDDFYADSTEAERNELIQFAIHLAKSDHIITKDENIFLDELFNRWTDATDAE